MSFIFFLHFFILYANIIKNTKGVIPMSDDKKIEIVSGDDSDLDISPVHDRIGPIKPQNTDDKKPKNIVIPKEKKEEDKK